MEDWKQRLIEAVRKVLRDEVLEDCDARYQELAAWLAVRQMKRLREITDPAHVVELMEMLDRWRNEDAAKPPPSVSMIPISRGVYGY